MATKQPEERITDLTVVEFRQLIRETVAEAMAELLADPDEGLELRGEFVAEMERRLASDESTLPAEEVYRRRVGQYDARLNWRR